MCEEHKSFSGISTMVTLTYNEQSVPKNYYYNGTIYKSAPFYNYDNTDELVGKRGGRKHPKMTARDIVYDYDKTTGEQFIKYGLPEDAPTPIQISWKQKNKELSDEVQQAIIDNIPISFNSVRKEDVAFFIANFRKVCTKPFSIFLTSEYGPTTYRPHYHAIFFGLTPDDLRPLTESWKKHMGNQIVVNQVVDNGSFNYVSKYCSKGSFENPFCAKDFFYAHADGKMSEYHSKNYERCLDFFGINEPLCDPTFHTISKGIGIGYLKNKSVTEYHKRIDRLPDGKWDLSRIINNKKYTFQNGKKINLPKYYYEKICGPYVRAQVSQILQEINDAISRSELEFMETCYFEGTPSEVIRDLTLSKEMDNEMRKKQAFERFNNKYKKSMI